MVLSCGPAQLGGGSDSRRLANDEDPRAVVTTLIIVGLHLDQRYKFTYVIAAATATG